MQNVTIVSALFNIQREKIDGRTWAEYLQWFDITLKLQCPMVIFTTEDVKEFIDTRRADIPTKVIVQTIKELPYYYLKEQLDTIIASDHYKKNISIPGRIECKTSLYCIIQYSKFKWLERVIKENPFNSKIFFWLDAGGSRFFYGYDLSQDYPSPNAYKALLNMEEKFLLEVDMMNYKDLVYATTLSERYLLDNRSYTCGTMFGGTKNAVLKVAKDMEEILLNKMIAKGFINNEQIAFGYLIKQNPTDFKIFLRYISRHAALFAELGKHSNPFNAKSLQIKLIRFAAHVVSKIKKAKEFISKILKN